MRGMSSSDDTEAGSPTETLKCSLSLEPSALKGARSVRQEGDGKTRRAKARKVQPVPTLTLREETRSQLDMCA